MNESHTAHEGMADIDIFVEADGRLRIDGEPATLEDLSKKLSNSKPRTAAVVVVPGVSESMVERVQEQLRAAQLQRINYRTQR